MLRLKATKTRLYKLVSEYETLPLMGRTNFIKAYGRPEYKMYWTDADGLKCMVFFAAVGGKPKLVITKKEFDGLEVSRVVYTLCINDLTDRGMTEEYITAAERRRAEGGNA